jgi:asparagine synthase (glutamine-hydrolysing)
MCGIAGFFNLDGSAARGDILHRMVALQHHRGPDDSGACLFSLANGSSRELLPEENNVYSGLEGAIGFNRLSIQDLSAHGHQPMFNAERSIILAFNGEIYNARQYTAELAAKGYQFRGTSDTEVILSLYEEYGLEGMLSRLNGMFAIVIVDLRQQQIVIARDPLGIKPMYWTTAGESLLFASEVKSFLAHPDFKAELDPTHLDEYLAFRYVAGEDYLLKGVHQLRPGHVLRINPTGRSIERYWQIPDVTEKRTLSDADALDEASHLFGESVRSQLLSDVPLGCQLSGGIDSSLVTTHARSNANADLQTFSVIFDDPSYSEEPWIDEVARVTKAKSHRFTFTDSFFHDTLSDASWHLDKPLNHPNSLGIWLLARESKKQVTVLLSGEGADEVFGGYTRFYYASMRPKLAPWLPLLSRLPKIGQRLERQFGGDAVNSFIGSSLWMRPDLLRQLRPEANFETPMEKRRQLFSEGKGNHLGNCLKYDMQTYMVDLLVRQDKMTMAHSVENRVPFLDKNLVEFARHLPDRCLVSDTVAMTNTKMRGTKVLLKKLARRSYSDAFVYRKKSGFSLPLVKYFQDPRFEALMEDQLLPGMAKRGLVDAKTVRHWWKKTLPNDPSINETLWIPVALEIWAQRFIDQGMPSL